MKNILLILSVAMLALLNTVSAKEIIRHSTKFTKEIADSTIINVYVLFPDWQSEWYISETLPTKTKGQWLRGTRFLFPEQVSLVFELAASGGDDDSLAIWIQPLAWDDADAEFAEITTDSSRFLIGTARDYVSGALNYFDWTAATEYHVPLIRWSPTTAGTDAIFWPLPGFVLHIRYVDASGGTPQFDLTVSGVFEE